MFARSVRRVWLALPIAALLAACEVPNVPTDPGFGGNAPTVSGSVAGEASSDLRVGLIGGPAGRTQQEAASAAVVNGAYTLSLPSSPRLDLMVNDNESYGFSLRAYRDLNGNRRYDAGDELTDAVSDTGVFRYFVSGGAPGTYVAGWNLYKDGVYVQNFSTAFNLRVEA